MLKSYIKKVVKSELVKEKLNSIYGSKITYSTEIDNLKELVSSLNGAIHQQNSGLSKSYNTINSLQQENKKLIVDKEVLKDALRESNSYVSFLEKEIEQLKEYREIDFKSSLHSGFQSEELKQENEKLKKENEKLKESIEKFDGKLILKDNLLSEQKQENEKLKSENKQLKNLSSTIVVGNDGKLDSLFNQKLKSENEKLQRKLREIKKEIDSQGFDHEGFYNLQNMYHRIENILKES